MGSLIAILTAALMTQAKPPVKSKTAAPQAKAESAARKGVLDEKRMEEYVRHLEMWPDHIAVKISEPKPSSLPGFVQVDVHGSVGDRFQDVSYLVSTDGSRIVKGQVFDAADNPFRAELTKLKGEGAPALGTSGAPVALVVFSDFQCQYCKDEAKTLRQNLVQTYPKDVRLYFKDYPLTQIHPWAKDAAIAGRCAFQRNPDAFWDYHDWVFENQASLTAETLKGRFLEWAKGKGWDTAKLTTCVETRATETEVDKTIAEARALAVSSTPTLFINGRRISATLPWENLKQIIDYEIKYQRIHKNAGDDCGCEVKLPSLTGAR